MQITIHEKQGQKIVEAISDSIIIKNAQDALELIMNSPDPAVDKWILHQKNINPDFFVLSSGIAGDVLQKFVNYHMQLAIVGDFKKIESKSLQAFILECNRGNQIFFVENVEMAKQKLLKSA